MKAHYSKVTAVFAGALFCLFAANPAFSIEYKITDIGTLGGVTSEAWDINNNDDIVGRAHLPDYGGATIYHAFLYSAGVLTDLGLPQCTDPYGNSWAFGINDSGLIAGVTCAGGGQQAFTYSSGTFNLLGFLNGPIGDFSDGRAINNLGHVVGSSTGAGNRHAFLHRDGTMLDLGTLPGGTWSFAYGVNDLDQVVGYATVPPGDIYHPFLYSDGVMADLTPGLGCCGIANGINNFGKVVGIMPGDQPFMYSNGSLTDLGGLTDWAGSTALSINNHDQIVGGSTVGNNLYHAFIYENGTMVDLNSLIPADSGWVLNFGVHINDRGRIVGIGTIGGQTHGFLLTPPPQPAKADFDGDTKSDTAVWNSTTGLWTMIGSSTGDSSTAIYGISGDMPVLGDFDGDKKADVAVWRPSNGTWFVMNSATGTQTVVPYGIMGDNPVPGDYDGDKKTDIAVWRPSNGTWFIMNSATGTQTVIPYGTAGDIPVPGDYDGDGKTDVAVWRPSDGTWYVKNSATDTQTVIPYGATGDIPVPGDYDGDSKTDQAVWRPSNGTWFILNSATDTQTVIPYGTTDDIPVPGDYDGDGKVDMAVWRPSTGTYYIRYTSNGEQKLIPLGASTDQPVNGVFPASSASGALVASAGDSQVVLNWPQVARATAYKVYRGTAPGVTKASPTNFTSTTNKYVDTSVANGTTYYYMMTPIDPSGEGAASTEASARPQVNPPPFAPTDVYASAGPASIGITWTSPTGATSYNVYYGTAPGVTKESTMVNVPFATNWWIINSGITNGTKYYLAITAVNANGESPLSVEVSATPGNGGPIVPPTPSANAGNNKVDLSWEGITGVPVSYNVYMATCSPVIPGPGTLIASGLTGTSTTIASLNPGTTYYFVMTVIYANTESLKSSEVNATPQFLPAAPSASRIWTWGPAWGTLGDVPIK